MLLSQCKTHVALGALMLLLGAGMSACATSRRVVDRYPVGNQGGSWEVVLPGLAVSDARAAAAGVGPEYARRDGALGVRRVAAVRALDAWPQPARPELSDVRRLWLRRTPGYFLYIEPHRGRRSGW